MSYITTVEKVKTIIPHQAVVNYLVKNYLIEEKIANVTTLLQGFLDFDYRIDDALIATSVGLSGLNTKHIGITNVLEVYYIASTGYEYTGDGYGPILLTADVDYTFRTFDFILDDVYSVKAYTIALSREFIEQTIYGGVFESKNEIGYIQYKVLDGNDAGENYQSALAILGDTPFFMDSVAQQALITQALRSEGSLSPIIQLLAAYIVAKDVIVEYILPVFKQDQANNLAGVQLNAKDLLPGFEEFLDSLDDKIADIWALLKYKGKVFVNPNGPNGPEDGPFADKAKTVVRGEKKYTFETPFGDSHNYHRKDVSLDDFLNTNPFDGI